MTRWLSISLILVVFYNCIALWPQGTYFAIKAVKRHEELSFPLITTKSQDSIPALRINQMLQLTKLMLVINKSTSDPFVEVSPLPTPVIGYVGINYKIHNNTSAILSVGFDESGCGATCHYGVSYYNFNAGNGDLIQLEDLIQPSQYQKFKLWLLKKRSIQLRKAYAKFRKIDEQTKNVGEVDINGIIDGYKTDEIPDFYIKDSILYVNGYNYLSKDCKVFGLDALCKLNTTELKPYLSAYGRVALGLRQDNIAKFRSSSLPQIFVGTIASQPIAMVLEKYGIDKIKASYAYLKYGKAISLMGTLKSGSLNLIEQTEEEKVNGYIEAQWKGSFVHGKWYNTNRSRAHDFSVGR